jgi:hypothetical protein
MLRSIHFHVDNGLLSLTTLNPLALKLIELPQFICMVAFLSWLRFLENSISLYGSWPSVLVLFLNEVLSA